MPWGGVYLGGVGGGAREPTTEENFAFAERRIEELRQTLTAPVFAINKIKNFRKEKNDLEVMLYNQPENNPQRLEIKQRLTKQLNLLTEYADALAAEIAKLKVSRDKAVAKASPKHDRISGISVDVFANHVLPFLTAAEVIQMAGANRYFRDLIAQQQLNNKFVIFSSVVLRIPRGGVSFRELMQAGAVARRRFSMFASTEENVTKIFEELNRVVARRS